MSSGPFGPSLPSSSRDLCGRTRYTLLMPKKQTRRAISVRGVLYEKVQSHCAATGKTVSGWVEEIVAAKLDAVGAPPAQPDPKLAS